MHSVLILLVLFFCFPLSSEGKNPLQKNIKEPYLELISPQAQIQKGETFLAGIRIKIPQDWYSYWSFAGDFGQAPTIQWKLIKGVKIQPLPFPTPERKAFFINEKQSYSFIYEKELLIPFTFFVEEDYTDKHLPLSLDLQWFICKDICLSKQNSLDLDLKIGTSFTANPESKKVFDFWEQFFPKKLNLKSYFKVKDEKLIISFSFEEEIKCLDLFPKKERRFFYILPYFIKSKLALLFFSA